jgi:hypothetical protein
MLIASVAFHVLHPGRIMSGNESDMPGFYERRKMKRNESVNLSNVVPA